MKKLVWLFFVAATLIACDETDKKVPDSPKPMDRDRAEELSETLKDSANYTSMHWTDSTYRDMGSVKKGVVVEIPFSFTNTGAKNLIIESVAPGCGCTVADKPEKPIMPGKSDVIKASFDTKSQSVGTQRKSVTVVANTMPSTRHVLTFVVQVTE